MFAADSRLSHLLRGLYVFCREKLPVWRFQCYMNHLFVTLTWQIDVFIFLCSLLLLVSQAPLGVRRAERRHQSPEWTILSHSYCLIQWEIVRPQVLLDSLHPCSTRMFWWSAPVLRRGSSYDTPGICLVWHSRNVAKQRRRLLGCPPHLSFRTWRYHLIPNNFRKHHCVVVYIAVQCAVRGCRPGKTVHMTEAEVRALCLKSREIFLSQPILLELEAPLKICGKVFSIIYQLLCNKTWLTVDTMLTIK